MAKRKRLTRSERLQVYEKYGGCCAYCGKPLSIDEMQVDHKVPLRLGGEAVIRTIAPHTHHFIDMPAYEGGTFIECSECTCAVSGKTNKEAIGAWNRRA